MDEKLTKEELKDAGGKLEGTEQWQDAAKELQQEKKDQARAVEEFAAYEELNGVRIYAPSAKHNWALAAFAQEGNNVINAMLGGYILGVPGIELDRIFAEAKDGTLEANALEFVSQFDLAELGELIAKLFAQSVDAVPEEDSKN